jgi:hypothetical protein
MGAGAPAVKRGVRRRFWGYCELLFLRLIILQATDEKKCMRAIDSWLFRSLN